jgi:hypothetical protein
MELVTQLPNNQAQDHRTATTTASPGDGLNVNPVGSTLSCFSAQFVQKVLTTYIFSSDMGILHADQRSRDSLPCDLMEPVRPKVDAFIIDLLQRRTFNKNDFFETREGMCRIMPPLTHQLAEPGPGWAIELGPVTERVAKMLFADTRNSRGANGESKLRRKHTLPTPLTEGNRSAGRDPYRRKPESKTVEEMRQWLFR